MPSEDELGEGFIKTLNLIAHGTWGQMDLVIKEVHRANTIKMGNKKLCPNPVLSFSNHSKMFKLNGTNSALLVMATGVKEGKELVGRRIRIYAIYGDWRPFTQCRLSMRIREGDQISWQDAGIDPKMMGEDITGQVQGYEPEPRDTAMSDAEKQRIVAAGG